MTSGAKTLLTLLGGCIFATVCSAVTADNPYHTIVDRNPFGLNPPPPTQDVSTNVPPKNVKFNGITKAGGRKRAFFTIPDTDPKKQPLYVTLAEGDKADVLEVNKIFEDEGEVEVVNSGIKMVLNFKNNGNKGAAVAPQPGGAPQPVPVPQPIPNHSGAVYNPGAANPVLAQPPVQPQPQPLEAPIPGQANANAGQTPPAPPEGGLRQIPTRTLRLNPVNPPPQPP